MSNFSSNINPYITGQAVRSDDFFGRAEDLQKVEDFLRQDKKTHLFITAHRRSGKTSFLKEIQTRFATKNKVILYLNLQDKADTNLQIVLKQIRNRTGKHLNFSHPYYNKQAFGEYINAALENKDKQLVWLFDEFDVMNPDNTEPDAPNINARNAFQHFFTQLPLQYENIRKNLKIIYAAGTNYAEESSAYKKTNTHSAFLQLSPLNLNDTRKLLSLTDLPDYDSEALKLFYEQTGGNPFFSQILASEIYDEAQAKRKSKIDRKIIEKSVKKSIIHFDTGIGSIWEMFRVREKEILQIASHLLNHESDISVENIRQNSNFPVSEIQDSLKSLVFNQFIKKAEGNYNFSALLFADWIHENTT